MQPISYNIPTKIDICRTEGDRSVDIEGNAHTTDQNAKTLYLTVVEIYKFFKANHAIDGIDGEGSLPLFCIKGKEDTLIDSGIICRDYMYALQGYVHPMEYIGQVEALRVAGADIAGIIFRQSLSSSRLREVDWKIGDHHLRDHITLLSLMNENSISVDDASRLLGRAFYLAVKKSSISTFEAVGEIWLSALLKISSKETFYSFATKVINDVQKLGDNNLTRKVILSWVKVGIIRVPRVEEELSA